MTDVVLGARGVCRRFGGVVALDDVDLDVRGGEVLAVVGENGAGKSTLMRILAGVDRPDAGRLELDGRSVSFDGPGDAQRAGVALIHQELALADSLDVAESLFLGRETTRWGFPRRADERASARRWLDLVGLDVSPRARIGELTLAQRQLVEIARALSAEARVLIMDEPTACLTPGECERLFDVVRRLRDDGTAVVLISHRLREVESLADRAVVLRDGRRAGELDAPTADALVPLMVGRDIAPRGADSGRTCGDVVLSVRGLVRADRAAPPLSLDVRAGEIVALAGLVGSGRTGLLETLFGLRDRARGEVLVAGANVPPSDPRAAVAAGLALVPEDRRRAGLLLDEAIATNVTLPRLALRRRGDPLLRGPFTVASRELDLARASIETLGVRAASPAAPAASLSGGNQQKVVLARWLATAPRVLLLDEPTRGVDVGAKDEIYALLRDLAADGLAVLFASSDLEEVLALADRVLVVHDGALRGDLTADDATEESILQHATGGQTS